jgi:hypothetical protein
MKQAVINQVLILPQGKHDIFVFSEAGYCLRILFGGSFNVPRKRKTTIKYVIETEKDKIMPVTIRNTSHNRSVSLEDINISR